MKYLTMIYLYVNQLIWTLLIINSFMSYYCHTYWPSKKEIFFVLSVLIRAISFLLPLRSTNFSVLIVSEKSQVGKRSDIVVL